MLLKNANGDQLSLRIVALINAGQTEIQLALISDKKYIIKISSPAIVQAFIVDFRYSVLIQSNRS